jgi:hypothetical protein
MPSYGMSRRAALVITYVSEEHMASTTRVTKIGELETLAVTIERSTQMMEGSSETSALTRTTLRNIPEGGIP